MDWMESKDLHGSAPDESELALVLVDVINPLDFDGAERPVARSKDMSARLAALCRRARELEVPLVYANDNFGRWRSDQRSIVENVLDACGAGAEIVRPLLPERVDYFVVKPKMSAFYSTTLDLLLRHLGAKRLIITGFQTHLCVLFTANDAYLRDFEVYVPEDCVQSESEQHKSMALELMRDAIGAETRPSTELELERLLGR